MKRKNQMRQKKYEKEKLQFLLNNNYNFKRGSFRIAADKKLNGLNEEISKVKSYIIGAEIKKQEITN